VNKAHVVRSLLAFYAFIHTVLEYTVVRKRTSEYRMDGKDKFLHSNYTNVVAPHALINPDAYKICFYVSYLLCHKHFGVILIAAWIMLSGSICSNRCLVLRLYRSHREEEVGQIFGSSVLLGYGLLKNLLMIWKTSRFESNIHSISVPSLASSQW